MTNAPARTSPLALLATFGLALPACEDSTSPASWTLRHSAAEVAPLADSTTPPDTTSPPAPPPAKSVTPTGVSSGDCTATPCNLAYAFKGAGGRLKPGDTVWVRGGTYGGTTRYEVKVAGSAMGHVVFSGYPDEVATIKNYTIVKPGSHYLTLRRLVFEGPIAKNKGLRLEFVHDVTVTECEIRGWRGNAGLQTTHTQGNIEFTRNWIHHNGSNVQVDHGIYIQASEGAGTGNVAANNLLEDNAARGISIHDNSGTLVKHWLVAHNTFYSNGSTGLLVNDADSITVVNNVFAENGADRGQPQMWIQAGNNNQVRNNLTFSSNSSLAGIRNDTQSPMSGNLVADPQFVGAADFHLQMTSPAVGLGLPGYASEDFEGKARDAAPDAGALEQ